MDKEQIAILAQISDAEARIGRKTYTQIEDAIADAGTKYGKDGIGGLKSNGLMFVGYPR